MLDIVHPLVSTLMLWSVLVPAKMWYAPTQPILMDVKPEAGVSLVLTDFAGQDIQPQGPVEFKEAKTIDLRDPFPAVSQPGTYVLWAVPIGVKGIGNFTGTPLVIESRQDKRPGAPPGTMVTKIEPLRYAEMETDQGAMTLAFYYDVAPNTANNFMTLAEQGYFDGVGFHRIIPGFVIQGGDPRGDGTGGPGYQIEAEFSDRKHLPGVLSMARSGDPMEGEGAPPRPEFANSAGSQFFICLDHENTKHLDGKYTAFGTVVDGMDVVRKIAATPLRDAGSGTPVNPPVIKHVEVKTVISGHNPYATMMIGK